MERSEVYKLIDGERAYQNRKWNAETTTSRNEHSVEEWFMYIEDYVNEAKHLLTRMARQDAYPLALGNMRKVAAMAVAVARSKELSETDFVDIKGEFTEGKIERISSVYDEETKWS